MRFRAATVLLEELRQSLWVLPAAGVVVAVLLNIVLVRIDRALANDGPERIGFGGGAEGARGFLDVIGSTTLTMATLTFTVTMLVLQLASNQMSPRVLRTFLRDRTTQVVLALFVATFTYALLSMRAVRDDFVPGLTVWAALGGALLSVGGFVYFINHIAQSIRHTSLIERVGNETRASIEHLYPQGIGAPSPSADRPEQPPDREFRWGEGSGVLVAVDEEHLRSLCEGHTCTLELVPTIGGFVGTGSVFARAWGRADEIDGDRLERALTLSVERTMQQDAAFGFRQLVDVAERALSPGVNDPTTAVQVLDQIHDLLLRLADRDIPSPLRETVGSGLLILPRRGWDEYVALALDEIAHYGRDSIQVRDRMRLLLRDLLDRVSPERRPPLRRRLVALEAKADLVPARRDGL